MFARLRTRRVLNRTARSLYGSIVTAARRPAFYANWGVPDTIQGRFEMIAAHLALQPFDERAERLRELADLVVQRKA